MDKPIAFSIPFMDVCQLFEKISNERAGKGKVGRLRKFCDNFRKVYQKRYKTMNPSGANGDSLFCIMRILFATEDKLRPPFGFKAVKLALQFPKIFGLDRASEEGQKFLNFKDPKQAGSAAGDLSQIIFDYLSSRTSSVSGNPLNIGELHQILDSLAGIFAAGASKENFTIPDKQRIILQNLYRRVSATEGKWLTRILLRRLDLGMASAPVFACIHPCASELYNRNGDLEGVCIDLNDPTTELKDNEIELFKPFQNMLCTRLTSLRESGERRHAVPSYFNKDSGPSIPLPPFVIEIKWDGERFQIHYDSSRADSFRYFSRSRREYSVAYEDLLTPKIRPQIHPNCKSFILDGEMMVWSLESLNFIQKALSPELRRTSADHPEFRPVFVAFDVVYFNGENLEGIPLQQRMDILMNKRLVFEPQEGVIILSKQHLVQDNPKEQVVRALNKAIDGCEEGLVIKEYMSKYEIGKRGVSWLKLKPEYLSENSVSDLDLIILGGYFTKSQLKGGVVNSFLVGLLDDDLNSSRSSREQFYAITTVGPGHLKNPQLWQLVKELEPNFIPKEKKPNFNIRYDSRPRPDFYINPTMSIVLQVKASQIIFGDAPQYSLNFPRITAIRRDKRWKDIMTFSEFKDLFAATSSGRLVKRNDSFSPRLNTPTRSSFGQQSSKSSTPSRSHWNFNRSKFKSPAATTVSKSPQEPSPAASASSSKSMSSKGFSIPSGGYKNKFSKKPETSTSSTKSSESKQIWSSQRGVKRVMSHVLTGRVFLVVGSPDFKSRVTTEIVENGGQVVQNPTKDLFAIIAEKISMRVDKFMKEGTHSVLKYSWLQKCIDEGTVDNISPQDSWTSGEEVTGVTDESNVEMMEEQMEQSSESLCHLSQIQGIFLVSSDEETGGNEEEMDDEDDELISTKSENNDWLWTGSDGDGSETGEEDDFDENVPSSQPLITMDSDTEDDLNFRIQQSPSLIIEDDDSGDEAYNAMTQVQMKQDESNRTEEGSDTPDEDELWGK